MTNFKKYLSEADYQYAQSGTSLGANADAEYKKRLKLFGFDHNGESTFQVPFDDLWTGQKGYGTEYTRHISLVDPDYKHMTGELDWRDPATLRGNIEQVRKGDPALWKSKSSSGDTPASVFASGRIAELTQGLKDAEHYQKIKSQIPQLLKQGSKGMVPGSPSTKFDPKVKELQDRILAKDPNALPKYGADGRMGSETRAAMQRLGIKESLELQRILDIVNKIVS